MNVKVSETVKYKLDIMNNLLGEVMNDLKPDLTQATTYETKEDEFRHLLCVLSMSDCIHGVRKLRYVASLTDAEVQEMCAESDITVSTAIQNMKHNMVGEIMSDLLGGLLTPPPPLTRCDLCISSLRRTGTTASVTCAESRFPLSLTGTGTLHSAALATRARPRLPRSPKHCSGASHT